MFAAKEYESVKGAHFIDLWDGVRQALSEERLMLPLASPCCFGDTVEWVGTSG